MKAQHLLITVPLLGSAVEAFVASNRRSSFVGRSPTTESPSLMMNANNYLRMDLEEQGDDRLARLQLEEKLFQQQVSLESIMQQQDHRVHVDAAQAAHGMPWRESIGGSTEEDALLYMPFWEWQMSFMKDNLSNLRVLPATCQSGLTDFGFQENDKKKARIVNLCFASDEYRKIRMTYYDAGENTQVFNSVWYPDPSYNLPVLGIDLLAFNRKKYLAIVDFQPLHENEDDHAVKYEHLLKPVKEEYESLKGRMSSKFYDETQFFSQQMLFARFEDESIVNQDLMPAFQAYVQIHLDLVTEHATPQDDQRSFVMNRQRAYDTYSAERDPATGLFAAMFGQEWADDFVYDFLFSMSERKEGSSSLPKPPMMMGGGGPPPQQQQQRQATAVPGGAGERAAFAKK